MSFDGSIRIETYTSMSGELNMHELNCLLSELEHETKDKECETSIEGEDVCKLTAAINQMVSERRCELPWLRGAWEKKIRVIRCVSYLQTFGFFFPIIHL